MGISHAYNYIIAGSDLRVKPSFRARIWMLLKLPAELEEFAMEKSKVAVRYFSKSGNTKNWQTKLQGTVGCQAEQIPAPIDGNIDILFLGASVYWGGISSEVKAYIQTLDKSKISKVVAFSTSALAERAFPQIHKKLQDKGIQ